jgi:hypothetical protein
LVHSWRGYGNAGVNPADGLQFPGGADCNFYKWAWQMFLWLNSPPPFDYGGGTHVFSSPVFYRVSPLDVNGDRTFIPQLPDKTPIFSLRNSQVGPLGNPVAVDKAGKLVSVARLQVGPNGKTIIPNRSGRMIEIERTEVGRSGKPIFLDVSGKAIDFQPGRSGYPILIDESGKTIEIGSVKVGLDRKANFFDPSGNVVTVDQGQAEGSGVLMAQNCSSPPKDCSLVYYATHVNDVYAYFHAGTNTSPVNGGITPTPTEFPTKQDDLDKIIAFAKSKGKTSFPDSNALAIEVKSAWIETTGLDETKYVTMTATIPVYNKLTPYNWNRSGSKQAKLALVGMHVVGSTLLHPEMIWATFEHKGNTPNAAYSYMDNGGMVRFRTAAQEAALPAGQGTGGNWLFSRNNSTGPFNKQLQNALTTDHIVSPSFQPIGPSDTLRLNPWGSPGSVAASKNTDVISINSSVLGQLELVGDVRANYLFHGATWTKNGSGAGGPVFGLTGLANTTMETYHQGSNCFSCHTRTQEPGASLGIISASVPHQSKGLSHMFGPLRPLFP